MTTEDNTELESLSKSATTTTRTKSKTLHHQNNMFLKQMQNCCSCHHLSWLRCTNNSNLKPRQQAIACCFYLLALIVLANVPSSTFGQTGLDLNGDITNVNQQVGLQEILVQPNSQVRIECKLPLGSKGSSYYWNYKSTSDSARPYLLSYENKRLHETTFGYSLEMDVENGLYDIVITNATYELNDGIYYCNYKDTKQTLIREYRLTVLLPPQPPAIVPTSQTPAHEGQEFQLNCVSFGGNPEPNITWFRNDQPLASGSLIGSAYPRIEQTRINGSTTSSLTWLAAFDDHQAIYKCQVWNKAMSLAQILERELRLQIEYAPRISLGTYNPLKVLQGTSVTLPCLVDANPPVKGIRWFKDGKTISNQFNHTINEITISDSGLYSCQADNGIAPVIGSQLTNLHGQMSVAVPSSSFLSMFGFTGSNSQSSATDAQILRTQTTAEAHLHLQVLYPPRVQVKLSNSGPLNEGNYVSLNCSVDSMPPAHEFIWTKQDDPTFRRVFPSSQSSFLELTAVTPNDMGNYTCTAINRIEPSGYNSHIDKQGSGSSLLLVRHKPGLAEIVVGQSGETELGARTLIQCRAKPPGYPDPQYKFWKFQGAQKSYLSKQSSLPNYTIYAAKPDDEAKFGCMATNELGTSTDADGDLIVNEPPTIIHDTSARRDEDARTPGESSYSITVRASGKPEPKVTWFHRSPIDGRRLELSSLEMQSRFRIDTITKPDQIQSRLKYNVVSTLTFKNPLEVDDRGLYSVEFNNGLSRSAIEDFQLHIHHTPIPAPKNQPIIPQLMQKTRIKAGFDPNETANLVCRVSAYPKPEFQWYPNGPVDLEKTTDGNSRYKQTVTNPRDDIWESTLTFGQVQESDYGDWMCASGSRDGKQGETIQIVVVLSKKTIPDPPIQLEYIESTQDSITIQWIPGFDGGFTQNQYLVHYAPEELGKNDEITSTAQLSSNSLLAEQNLNEQQFATLTGNGNGWPKVHDCSTMNPCTIQHLSARQAYILVMRAKNELGFSRPSDELRALTRANISHVPKIIEASFDSSRNVLHFRIESGSEYLLNNLNARIEVRSFEKQQHSSSIQPSDVVPYSGEAQEISANQQVTINPNEWRFQTNVLIRQEKQEVFLDMQSDIDQLRITLCSRTNESLCGAEVIVMKSATSSFLHDQHGLSLSILMSTLILIIVLGVFATTVHSCCLSRKTKKVDSIERIEGSIDNKPIANGNNNSSGNHKSSLGSTTSTNSTSVANGANGLQSMDSINGCLNGGSASDHSSDHSRQAKLDSMLPPNYNHYADRASIMLEQQQQQHHLMQQQQGLMQQADKLGSPFGLPNSALLSVANHQSGQMPSPLMNGGHFAYGHMDQAGMSLEHATSMMDANMMLNAGYSSDLDVQQQQMWQQQQTQINQMDNNANNGYNAYNALNYSNQQQEAQMIDPTYGTTTTTTGAGGLMLSAAQSAAYDNSANSGSQFHQSYLSAYSDAAAAANHQQYQQEQQQRVSQYQQDLAAAQQQMYGTLTRGNNYSLGNNNNETSNTSNQQLIEQQYSTTNGLIPPPSVPMGQMPQESDYGTTGGRSGRLIREIIV